jgi:hypothetical protein
MIRLGGILALVNLGAYSALYALWGEPLGVLPEGFMENPVDCYGVFSILLFFLAGIGVILFVWAVVDYCVIILSPRVRSVLLARVILTLRTLIRIWGWVCIIVGVRQIALGLLAALIGWPVGRVLSLSIDHGSIRSVAFASNGRAIQATTASGECVSWNRYSGKRIALPPETLPNPAVAAAKGAI